MAYSDLYVDLVADLPGIKTGDMALALPRAGRQFCDDTEAFREELPGIPLVDFQQDYPLTLQYNASVKRVVKVEINGGELNATEYDLVDERCLRLRGLISTEDYDDMLLKCGTAGSAVFTAWAAITNGSLGVTFEGTAYALSGITFAGCADMYQVASKIQTAIRTAMDGVDDPFCRWENGNRFAVWSNVYTAGYLTAGVGGTDISGASWMNGLTGAGTLGGHLRITAAFQPHAVHDDLPAWFLDRYRKAIVSCALWNLMLQKGVPWSNPTLAVLKRADYLTETCRARRDIHAQFKSGVVKLKHQSWP